MTARIPNIEPSIFLNRQFEGVPIVLHKRPYTAEVRLALLKLAREVCEIDENEIQKLEGKKTEKKRSFLGFLKKQIEPEIEYLDDEIDDLDEELDADLEDTSGSGAINEDTND